MPEELVLDLPATPPVLSGSVARLEKEVDLWEMVLACGPEIAEHIDYLRGSASAFEKVWRRFIQSVVDGQTERVQATRQKAQDRLVSRLDHLKRVHRMAGLLRRLQVSEVPEPDVLLPEIAGLERLKANVFDRWKTVEDLEDLVAETTAPTEREFNAVSEKYGPPTVWFEQCGEPRTEPS